MVLLEYRFADWEQFSTPYVILWVDNRPVAKVTDVDNIWCIVARLQSLLKGH